MVIINIIAFLLVLTLIVLIHEFGHFYFARRADILCHEFSIGMGPVVYQKRKGEIVYSIRLLPLGGFVAMAGEEMSDAYIKEGQTIGLRTNDDNVVTDIILDNELNYDEVGIVVDYDLYGEDYEELYIKLNINGEIKEYKVLRDAKYRFKGDKPMWITPSERSFETKTLWERFLVIVAGPVFNFILAFVLLFGVGIFLGAPNKNAVIGKVQDGIEAVNKGDLITHVNSSEVESYSDMGSKISKAMDNKVTVTIDGVDKNLDLMVILQGLGFSSKYKEDSLVVGNVFGRSKNLKQGDIITGLYITNQKSTEIAYQTFENWNDLIIYVENHSEDEHVYIRYERDEKEHTDYYLGIGEDTLRKLGSNAIVYTGGFEQGRKFSLAYPFYYPFKQIGSDVGQMVQTLALLFNPNEKVGVKDLSGPVGIFSLVSDSLSQGAFTFITFIAFLSVNIGLLNLLPIPALDGGRLVFLGYEAITKKKVNKNVENMLINITFILLLGLIIYVTFNDILRLFS